MKKEVMYARCLNTYGTDLEDNKEYKVRQVKSFSGFGDKVFYILENKKAYASCHFTVTYLKRI